MYKAYSRKRQKTAASSVSWVFVWLLWPMTSLASLFPFSLPPFLPLPFFFRRRESECCTYGVPIILTAVLYSVLCAICTGLFKVGIVQGKSVCRVRDGPVQQRLRLDSTYRGSLCSVFIPVFVYCLPGTSAVCICVCAVGLTYSYVRVHCSVRVVCRPSTCRQLWYHTK